MADLLAKKLHGFHLIDASAGTGKTYTITALVIRLLLERRLVIQEILVVTYTEAAASDLRVRIREMLVAARACFAGHGCSEPFLEELAARLPDHQQASVDLACALNDFDEAAIYTIHAFCQRTLKENSLESATLFDVELAADLSDIHWQVACDYWRRAVADSSPLFLHYLQGRLDPQRLGTLLAKDRPGLTLWPPTTDDADGRMAACEEAFERLYDEAAQAWPAAADEVAALLGDPALNGNKFRKVSVVRWLQAIDAYFRGHLLLPPDCLVKVGQDNLNSGVKKGCQPPSHPFCRLVDRLWLAWQELESDFQARFLALKTDFFSFAARRIAQLKEEQRLLGFDDLLIRLRDALAGPAGEDLSVLVKKKYPAALIDEFQDTDPIQFDIFSRIHGQNQHHLLYLIGDPKQAIYNFRGADIFAYLAATRAIRSHYSLEDNYRSAPGLIAAVNGIFQEQSGRPSFVFPEIVFQPARWPGCAVEELQVEEGETAPMQIMLATGDEPGKLLSAPRSKAVATTACCAEISRLLRLADQDRARLGTRPLAPRDIAVLVRTNSEARQVQQALAALGIKGVVNARDDLFACHEARELTAILEAVVEPASDGKMLAALATDILGWSAAELFGRADDEPGWDALGERFFRYQQLWQDKGFMAMFQAMISGEEVRERLLALIDGERRLTNLLHLGEVLQEQAGRPAHLLIDYLKEGLAGGHRGLHEQRLESDAQRLQIVTVHKAKGLQYPLVFCPFLWSGSKISKKNKEVFFHDANQRLVLDVGSEQLDQHRHQAKTEELAENLRLAYVALTRARHRCYLLWGPFAGSAESALAYLLHGRAGEDQEALRTRLAGMDDVERAAELSQVLERGQGYIAVRACPDQAVQRTGEAEERRTLGFRPFGTVIDRSWQVSSFSRLTAGLHQEAYIADRDRSVATAPHQATAEGAALTIFDFPRGAGPGTFLHHLLEHLDFRAFRQGGRAATEQWVGDLLAQFGFSDQWSAPVTDLLDQVTGCRLPGQDFCLADLAPGQRLNELEFYLPLAPSRASDLVEIFHRHQHAGGEAFRAQLARLDYRLAQGFMKGFIDLVFCHQDRFYIIDWKSNYLGHHFSDYQPRNLEEAMVEAHYILQYQLYTVALHRYLGRRLEHYRYEDHFGGVFYLFLRGVQPGGNTGIFSDRPAAELIADLNRLFAQPPVSEPQP